MFGIFFGGIVSVGVTIRERASCYYHSRYHPQYGFLTLSMLGILFFAGIFSVGVQFLSAHRVTTILDITLNMAS